MITLEAVWTDAVQAHCHRALLAALSHPCEVVDLGRSLEGRRAWIAVLATLADAATTLADPHRLLDDRDRGLLGALPAPVEQAAYVLVRGTDPVPADLAVQQGTLLAPERGATLVVDCRQLGSGPLTLSCTGPGVADVNHLAVDGLHPSWLELRERHCRRYPLGIDVVLADAHRIAAFPRTTRVITTPDTRHQTPDVSPKES